MRIEEQLNRQLEEAQQEEERLNVEIVKYRKGVANFKTRAKYLEGLI